MVDIGGKYGTPCGYFITHEFRGDKGVDAQFPAIHVFTDGYIFHFRCNYAGFGVCHLCDGLSGFGTIGQGDVFKAQVVQTFIVTAHLSVF